MHCLANIFQVCFDTLEDCFFQKVEHWVHLFVRFVHLESCLVKRLGELIQRDASQGLFMLGFDPLSFFLLDELLGLQNSGTHVFLASQSSTFQFNILLLEPNDQTAQPVAFILQLACLICTKLTGAFCYIWCFRFDLGGHRVLVHRLFEDLSIQLAVLLLKFLDDLQKLHIGLSLLLAATFLHLHVLLQKRLWLIFTLTRNKGLERCYFCAKTFNLSKINLLRIEQLIWVLAFIEPEGLQLLI